MIVSPDILASVAFYSFPEILFCDHLSFISIIIIFLYRVKSSETETF